MAAYKLERLERPKWEPPILTFVLERHGATAMGSSRAELQEWTVDVDAQTAQPTTRGRRQLYATNPRLDVRPIACEIAVAVEKREDHPWIRWYGDVVHPVLSWFLPEGVPKQTAEGRRRRLRDAVNRELAVRGWEPVGSGRYARRSREGASDKTPENDR